MLAEPVIAPSRETVESALALGPGGRYQVLPRERLPHPETPGTEACLAIDAEDSARPLQALLLDPRLPHRLPMVAELLVRPCPGLVRLLAAGPLDVPERGHRIVVVLERPEGGSVAARGGRWSEREVGSMLLLPLIEALDALEARGLAHRGVRPDNILFVGGESQRVVLGASFAGPPAYAQPAVYEPVERAAAWPAARGEASTAADWYALGVTIAGLLGGSDPAALVDDLPTRLARGSFATLADGLRLSPPMDALLHGLLHDDPEQRWDGAALRRWLSSGWSRPRASLGDRQAARGHSFAGREFRQPRVLALALGDPAERRRAVETICQAGFETWLRHNLRDTAAADRVRAAVAVHANAAGGSQDPDSELVTRVCRALDPHGPLHFRDLVVTRDGVGPLLAILMASDRREPLQSLVALLGGPLLTEPGTTPAAGARAISPHFAQQLRGWLRDRSLGAGLERCLYELNPSLPCQSALLETPASDVVGLLRALERGVRGDAGRVRSILDRHVAAFLASRSPHLDRLVGMIARFDQDPPRHALAVVGVFGELQRLYLPEALPGLTAWAGQALKPVIDSLHGATARRAMAERLPRLADDGSIANLLAGLDLDAVLRDDRASYLNARQQYEHLQRQIAGIDAAAAARADAARATGHWLATWAAFVALLASLATLFVRVTG